MVERTKKTLDVSQNMHLTGIKVSKNRIGKIREMKKEERIREKWGMILIYFKFQTLCS